MEKQWTNFQLLIKSVLYVLEKDLFLWVEWGGGVFKSFSPFGVWDRNAFWAVLGS